MPGICARVSGDHIVLWLCSEIEEPDGWVEGRGWMGALAGIRGDLLRGDLRALYLAWLGSLGCREVGYEDQDGDEEAEPPIP